MPSNNGPHHDFRVQFVGEIANSIKAFGVNKGYNLPDSFYEMLAWSGLQNTAAYNTLYPQYDSSGNINGNWVLINNTLASEQNNQITQDVNGNPINPQGVAPNSNAPCN